MSEQLSPGDRAPDFDLTAADGSRLSLGDLEGKKAILYFYPKAMTPGCRTQAIDFQANYTISWDKSDDDNERDPFSFRYARVTDLDKEYGYSDRDQRHRFNGFVLWNAPLGLDVNVRYSYRSAQPKSITETGADANTPQDRINRDGTVTQRNLGRKDNEFNSIDFRLSKQFMVGALTLEPILDVFNLTNSRNFKRPEVTSLIFNFDGTVQSGLGDPRQAQLGLRAVW